MLLTRDKSFVAAVLAGPVVWLFIYAFGLMKPASGISSGSLLLLVLVYPVIEEIIFRGSLQPALRRISFFASQRWGVSLANITSSILFSLLHLINQTPLWALLVFFPSLVFGYFMDKYGRLSLPVFLHCFYNAGYFLLLV